MEGDDFIDAAESHAVLPNAEPEARDCPTKAQVLRDEKQGLFRGNPRHGTEGEGVAAR